MTCWQRGAGGGTARGLLLRWGEGGWFWRREQQRSAVRLSASLACSAYGFPGNACCTWTPRYSNEWGKKVGGENLGAPLEKVAGKEAGLPHTVVCYRAVPETRPVRC